MMRDVTFYKKRVMNIAQLVLSGKTLRAIGAEINLSKSTVHHDIRTRLPYIDSELYKLVQSQLDKNFREKHRRGGEKTRKMYAEQKDLEQQSQKSSVVLSSITDYR